MAEIKKGIEDFTKKLAKESGIDDAAKEFLGKGFLRSTTKLLNH